MSDNWRIEVDAEDYFGHKQKKLNVADRRPVIRKSSDLAGMGPGFNATSVPISDFNDLIALYDGFFSATLAYNGPFPDGTGPDANKDPRSYVGVVVSDGDIGGYQQFTRIPDDLATARFGRTYRREFRRAESDPDYIDWGPWYVEGSMEEPIGTVKMSRAASAIPGWLFMDGSAFDGAAYPELVALLGGTTLPNMTNRFPLGGLFVGATGGSQFLTPHSHEHEHNHAFTHDTHAHGIDPAGSVEVQAGTGATVANAGHAHGGSTDNGGGGGSATGLSSPTEGADSDADTYVQMPPYLTLGFFIKATHLY